jgi:hypothetical protein
LKPTKNNDQLRASVIASCMFLLTSALLAMFSPRALVAAAQKNSQTVTGAPQVRGGNVNAAAPATPRVPAIAAAAPIDQAATPQQPSVLQGPSLLAYKGLGVWLDQFDFRPPRTIDPNALVDEFAARGVRTIFLQTGKWNGPQEVLYPEILNQLLDRAHANRINVVAWYLPGFNDIGNDVRRSLASVNYTTPSGQKFDGFGPDIEVRRAVALDSGRFNAGIIEYSKQLRAAVGSGYALGAITVDAKNNERSLGTWSGFPWPEIAQYYDVILPMAYWSVTKKQATCQTTLIDAAAYARDVIAKTQALMGT